MAEELKVSSTQYKNYERGDSFPYVDKLIAMCKILKVPADYLLKDEDRLFLDYSASYLFEELREMDDAQANMLFYVIQKLIEYKRLFEQNKDEAT